MIEVPPLRDRVDDIPILANHFLRVYCEKYNRGPMKINTHALEKLANYSWPGNVRELQHSIEKAVIMSDSAVLLPSDFEFRPSSRSFHHQELTLEEMEHKTILESLKRNGNNLSVVAEKLGITRQTLYNKLKKIDRDLL
jgi:DNA-binding NtrC family response regulator